MARLLVAQPFMEPPFRDRDSFALEAMSLIAGERPEVNVVSLLKEQPWFFDGYRRLRDRSAGGDEVLGLYQ